MNAKIKKKDTTVRSICFFLTIPQIDETMSKQSVKELLETYEPNLEKFVISEEIHTKDSSKGRHLHIWMRFTKRQEFSPKRFDYLGKHGKLEAVKASANVIFYITKEDEDPLSNFDVIKFNLERDFQGTVLRLIGEFKWDWPKLVNKYAPAISKKPWHTMKKFIDEKYHADEICAAKTLIKLRYIDRSLIEKRLTSSELSLFDSFDGYQQLVDVINKCVSLGCQQQHKDCTISIVGEPSIGKTLVFSKLGEYIPMYKYPEDGWHREYLNEVYSFIVWHEWSYMIHSPEDYLRLFEGIGTDLKIKGSKGIKRDRPMFILTSNESWISKIEKRYRRDPITKEIHVKAMKVRIKEIDFQFRDITFITKLFVRISEDI